MNLLIQLTYLGAIVVYLFMVRRHTKMVARVRSVIEDSKGSTDKILIYCIQRIREDAIKREDYEEAAICSRLIKELTEKTNETTEKHS